MCEICCRNVLLLVFGGGELVDVDVHLFVCLIDTLVGDFVFV